MVKRLIISVVVIGLAILGYVGVCLFLTNGDKDAAIIQKIQSLKQPSVSVSSDLNYKVTAREVIDLTNKYRQSKGLSILLENNLLDSSACLKGYDMATQKYFAHTSPDGTTFDMFFKAVGYHGGIGENLALGYETSDEIVTAWENSTEHNKNLLGDYSQIGVCVVMTDLIKFGDRSERNVVVAHYGLPQ